MCYHPFTGCDRSCVKCRARGPVRRRRPAADPDVGGPSRGRSRTARKVADPDLGFKPLLAKLRAQQPELGAATKEVREAVNALKAESEAKAAAAASPDKASALSHAALRAKSSQSAPWIQPGLKPLPPTALHQWVHEHDEEASVSEVPPSDTSVWAQFPESSSSPAEDGDWLNWPEQLLLRGTEAVGPPSPLCISRE